MLGSPPHTRGKEGVIMKKTVDTGITPAYAGKRCQADPRQALLWDHPRIRGEKKLPRARTPPEEGSPPHTRGKVESVLMVLTLAGITPAYAGKRKSGKCSRQSKKGSPPHTRGKACSGREVVNLSRITPAYAGKRFRGDKHEHGKRDHPRIRGEKSVSVTVSVLLSGSPPHTRGKGRNIKYLLWGNGITPAYAGKSDYILSLKTVDRDHPRIRGEKGRSALTLYLLVGSPPHTRGKATTIWIICTPTGITPAYAGKSTKS